MRNKAKILEHHSHFMATDFHQRRLGHPRQILTVKHDRTA